MSYSVESTPEADDDIAAIPSAIASRILAAFAQFARSPGTANSRSTPITYPAGQLFETDVHVQGIVCHVGIVFKYGQDEATLFIEHVYVDYV
jgi:hypothetical protein